MSCDRQPCFERGAELIALAWIILSLSLGRHGVVVGVGVTSFLIGCVAGDVRLAQRCGERVL